MVKNGKREAERPAVYVYNREILGSLLDAAGVLQPVLRMSADDMSIAMRHIAEGAWSVGVSEDTLPHFQQDPAHLRFCDEVFE